MLFHETQAPQRSRRLAFRFKRADIDDGLLVAPDQRDAIRRGGKLEGAAQQIDVVRSPGLESSVVQERSGVLRHVNWNRYNLGVLPIQLGHFLGSRLAMRASGVVEKQERVALSERHRLAIDGDGGGSLQARFPRRIYAERDAGKDHHRAQYDERATQALRATRPPSGEHGHQQHGAVFQKESRVDRALHQRETGAILADQVSVVRSNVSHEDDQQKAKQQSSPAAKSRNQDENRADHFPDAERQSAR